MKNFIEAGVAIICAVLISTALTIISPDLTLVLNIFNLVVIYFAFEKGEIYGASMGMVCGLIQDSFSIGVFGIAGVSKTLMGYFAGYMSRRINVIPYVRRIIFVLVLFTTEMLLWMLLYSFVISETFNAARGLFFLQPVCTAVLAMVVFPFIRKLEKALRRR